MGIKGPFTYWYYADQLAQCFSQLSRLCVAGIQWSVE